MNEDAQIAQSVPLALEAEPKYCELCNDDHVPFPKVPRDYAQQLYLDYAAVGGLTVDSDGEIAKMSMEMFAHKIGWSRRTLYDWEDGDPDWERKVLRRQKELWGGAKRIGRTWRSVYVTANNLASPRQIEASQMFLSHFSDYRPPKQRVENEVTINGFADVVKQAIKENVIEMSDDGSGNFIAETSSPDTAAHPE